MKQLAYRFRWCGLWFLILAFSISAFSQTPATQGKADKEYEVAAILWQQSSGEQRALAYQTFVLARMLLDRDLRNRHIRMRRAVIVDLDETVLDNSRYEAELVKQQQNYPQRRYHAIL